MKSKRKVSHRKIALASSRIREKRLASDSSTSSQWGKGYTPSSPADLSSRDWTDYKDCTEKDLYCTGFMSVLCPANKH